MTVDTAVSQIVFTNIVDGVPLNCDFPCSDIAWIKVRYGADILATYATHYTIALAGDFQSFTVTPVTGFAALSDGTISVSREPPLVQDFNLNPREAVGASALESTLDYITFLVQYAATLNANSVQFPTTDPEAARAVLPAAAARAGKYAYFDSFGALAAGTVLPDGTTVSAFGEMWVALANATAGLTALGLVTPGATGLQLLAAANTGAVQTLLGYVSKDDAIAFTGNNTFGGTSVFNGAVAVPTPTLISHPTTKKYVDDLFDTIPSSSIVAKAPTTQTITASGTYTTGTDGSGNRAKYIEITMIGGGGGGGGVNAGGNGALTSFGSSEAAGGTGGSSTTGGAGGSGGAGSSNVTRRARGTPGHASVADGATNTLMCGGNGGDSEFGAGGRGSNNANGEAAAANTGAGGGGGGGTDTTTAIAAGGGGSGERVQLRVSSPSATYAVVIGTGGTGGTAGGSWTVTGGAGGSGVVEVKEYYNW